MRNDYEFINLPSSKYVIKLKKFNVGIILGIIFIIMMTFINMIVPYINMSKCLEKTRETHFYLKQSVKPTSILLMTDIHISAINSFPDIYMSNMRKAINFYWKTDYTVALGDIMDSGGHDGHPRNIPDFIYSKMFNRAKYITQCRYNQSKCLFLPGNHDIKEYPPPRWWKYFPNTCLNQIYNLTSDISLLCLNTQQTNQSIKIVEKLQDVDKSIIFLSHKPWWQQSSENFKAIYDKYTIPLSLYGHTHFFNKLDYQNSKTVSLPTFNFLRTFDEKRIVNWTQGFGILKLDGHNGCLKVCEPYSMIYAYSIYCIITVSFMIMLRKYFYGFITVIISYLALLYFIYMFLVNLV